MKAIFILTAVFFLSSCAYHAGSIRKETGKAVGEMRFELEDSPLIKAGQRLVYDLQWLGIDMGSFILETKGPEPLRNRTVYILKAQLLPSGLAKLFFNREYTAYSYIDAENMRPLRFEKRRILPDGSEDGESLDFSYEDNKAVWKNSVGNQSKIMELPDKAQDLLSALFYFRNQPLALGQEYRVNIVHHGEYLNLKARVKQEAAVNVQGCPELKTVLVSTGLKEETFSVGFADMSVYFTQSKSHLPVLFRVKTKAGPIWGFLKCKASD